MSKGLIWGLRFPKDTHFGRRAFQKRPLRVHYSRAQAQEYLCQHVSQVAEAALAGAIFRAVQGDAVAHFGRSGHFFFYRTSSGGEVDFVVLPGPRAAASKYVDSPSTREARAMVTNFGRGLLLMRGAIDLRPGVTIIPAAIFAWLLDQHF